MFDLMFQNLSKTRISLNIVDKKQSKGLPIASPMKKEVLPPSRLFIRQKLFSTKVLYSRDCVVILGIAFERKATPVIKNNRDDRTVQMIEAIYAILTTQSSEEIHMATFNIIEFGIYCLTRQATKNLPSKNNNLLIYIRIFAKNYYFILQNFLEFNPLFLEQAPLNGSILTYQSFQLNASQGVLC